MGHHTDVAFQYFPGDPNIDPTDVNHHTSISFLLSRIEHLGQTRPGARRILPGQNNREFTSKSGDRTPASLVVVSTRSDESCHRTLANMFA